jgi:hypothetical protein
MIVYGEIELTPVYDYDEVGVSPRRNRLADEEPTVMGLE